MSKGRPKYKGRYSGYERYRRLTKRSLSAYLADKAKRAKVTNDLKKWLSNPSFYDFEGIDTPEKIFYYSKIKNGSYHYPAEYRKKYWKGQRTKRRKY